MLWQKGAYYISIIHYPLPKQQILDSFNLKEFAEDNFEFDKDCRKFSKRKKTLWEKEKLLATSDFSISHIVLKRLVLQTYKNQGLLGKGLYQVRNHLFMDP